MAAILLVTKQIKWWLQNANKNTNAHQQKSTPGSDKLVKCEQCGTYTPQNQALLKNDCYYCNQQCLTDKQRT